MAETGVWWNLQPFSDDGRSPFAPGTPNRAKQEEMWQGTDALFGPRNPYPGKLGVVQEGALADLKLIEDPGRNFVVIMKDGRVHKNLLGR